MVSKGIPAFYIINKIDNILYLEQISSYRVNIIKDLNLVKPRRYYINNTKAAALV